MWGRQELAWRWEVNTQGSIFELYPVDQDSSNDVPHPNAPVETTADKPSVIWLGKAEVCDLVLGSSFELSHFLQTCFRIENSDR